MRKILFVNSLLLAVSLLVGVSCDDTDAISIIPHFSNITSEPANPSPGDSITLTAHQDQIGHLLNGTTYDWTIRFSFFYDGSATKDSTFTWSERTNYDGIGKADPTIGFRIPNNIAGNLTVSLHASYNCSGQTEAGALYGQASCSNQITVSH